MRIVLDGERRRVDLGVANGRYFLLMAGVGLDAAIIPRVRPGWKRQVRGAGIRHRRDHDSNQHTAMGRFG